MKPNDERMLASKIPWHCSAILRKLHSTDLTSFCTFVGLEISYHSRYNTRDTFDWFVNQDKQDVKKLSTNRHDKLSTSESGFS